MLNVLFIGNSHTFCNEVPALFCDLAASDGFECHAVMLAHGGWTLGQHAKEPDVFYNLRKGHYDYVIFQEHTHPFNLDGKMVPACTQMAAWGRECGTVPVIFGTWAQKWEREKQQEIDDGCLEAAKAADALPVLVGNAWWASIDANPELELYASDGGHATPAGSAIAARELWNTISAHWKSRGN